MSKADTARDLFLAGANCAQAVAGAFAEECGMSQEEIMKLASGFGGGMARMREVCGTVSGMVLVMNILYGNSDLDNKTVKDMHYARLQKLLNEFKQENGSIICRELLGLSKGKDEGPVSAPRTPGFYKKRPCAELCALAAEIVEKAIASEQSQVH